MDIKQRRNTAAEEQEDGYTSREWNSSILGVVARGDGDRYPSMRIFSNI